MQSELRKEIMEDCPELFEDKLKDWIDTLEDKIGSVLADLEINGLEDLSRIEDAKNELTEIHDGLY